MPMIEVADIGKHIHTTLKQTCMLWRNSFFQRKYLHEAKKVESNLMTFLNLKS